MKPGTGINSEDGPCRTLRLVLGDQLDLQHSWFQNRDDRVIYLIAELRQETDYVRHHVQKLSAFFAAMASFARNLQKCGHRVLYLTLDETRKHHDLKALLDHLIKVYRFREVEYLRPDEYRLVNQLRDLELPSSVHVREWDTEHFLLPFQEIPEYFPKDRRLRMETFYRKMRTRFDILMDSGGPAGGRWNFDRENRLKMGPDDIDMVPEPLQFRNTTSGILDRLQRHGVAHFGAAADPLPWPVDRRQALELLEHFCTQCLPAFGRFQDAMTRIGDHRWSLYHSRLSFALNSKILSPLEVINTAVSSYEDAAGAVTLPQIEGFVRQILGWREFVRGVYWTQMPNYASLNEMGADRPLPGFFWTGETGMTCMREAIGQSLLRAYAHHIQRLMVTGNFCLLAGIRPDEVDEWYLGVYIDAIEWVEMPNTRGMSQFADGGIVASKPYAAGGNYINTMSDYCSACGYDVKDKTTEKACPFNCLYWHFMVRHRDTLASNPRIGMVFSNWDRQSPQQQEAILRRAQWCLENMEDL